MAFIYGTDDEITVEADMDWLINELGDSVIYVNTYPLGHLSYWTAVNMTYLEDVDMLLQQYPPTHSTSAEQ